MYVIWYVHNMNNKSDESKQDDDYRSLLLLDELSKGNHPSQRDLSKTLGVALGLINSYLRNLISKGYITVSGIPKQRYRYYLTPSGFAEKSRLTFKHFQNFTNLYKVARKDFLNYFTHLQTTDVKTVIFCGVDEIAEIAYLSLKETELQLAGIYDDLETGKNFFGQSIRIMSDLGRVPFDLAIITHAKNGEQIRGKLHQLGISDQRISDLGAGNWLRKVGA